MKRLVASFAVISLWLAAESASGQRRGAFTIQQTVAELIDWGTRSLGSNEAYWKEEVDQLRNRLIGSVVTARNFPIYSKRIDLRHGDFRYNDLHDCVHPLTALHRRPIRSSAYDRDEAPSKQQARRELERYFEYLDVTIPCRTELRATEKPRRLQFASVEIDLRGEDSGIARRIPPGESRINWTGRIVEADIEERHPPYASIRIVVDLSRWRLAR